MLALPEIPPHQAVVNSDICCPIDMPVPINIFAARVHAHGLGTVVTSYKYDPKTRGTELIIKGNPQWPQAFYPTTREFTITKGDEILMRCTYSSLGKSTFTYAGLTGSDEMCNVYLMYYTDNTDIGAEFQSCGYLCNAEQNRAYPADSIQPLPPNPILEAYAIHGKMNHQLRTNSTAASEESPIAVEPIIIDNKEADTGHNSSQHENSNSGGLMVDHDVHHHQHVEMETTTDVAAPAVPITQANKEVRREKVKAISSKSDSQKKDDNFWSFLFFFRRFFS